MSQRSEQEIIELQDKAIAALHQANIALALALQALQDARNEKGYVVPLPGMPVSTPPNPFVVPSIPNGGPFYIPNTAPNWPGSGQSPVWSTAETPMFVSGVTTTLSAVSQAQNALNAVMKYANEKILVSDDSPLQGCAELSKANSL